MDNLSSKIKTQADLKAWLEQSLVQLEAIDERVDNLRAEGGVRRMELAEARIESLAKQGMPYDKAFELVTNELEEQEGRIKASVDQARRERVALELEELTPEQEALLLEMEDGKDDDN